MNWESAYRELVAEMLKLFETLNSKSGNAQSPPTMTHQGAP